MSGSGNNQRKPGGLFDVIKTAFVPSETAKLRDKAVQLDSVKKLVDEAEKCLPSTKSTLRRDRPDETVRSIESFITGAIHTINTLRDASARDAQRIGHLETELAAASGALAAQAAEAERERDGAAAEIEHLRLALASAWDLAQKRTRDLDGARRALARSQSAAGEDRLRLAFLRAVVDERNLFGLAVPSADAGVDPAMVPLPPSRAATPVFDFNFAEMCAIALPPSRPETPVLEPATVPAPLSATESAMELLPTIDAEVVSSVSAEHKVDSLNDLHRMHARGDSIGCSDANLAAAASSATLLPSGGASVVFGKANSVPALLPVLPVE
ncbi:hypothetical protein H9P43_004917 [Blastocladiella emersonii ATCC 22665]|nr:hypothetical protein H9P43_004917 [Blastocladiella emersonii ATCC 22665]